VSQARRGALRLDASQERDRARADQVPAPDDDGEDRELAPDAAAGVAAGPAAVPGHRGGTGDGGRVPGGVQHPAPAQVAGHGDPGLALPPGPAERRALLPLWLPPARLQVDVGYVGLQVLRITPDSHSGTDRKVAQHAGNGTTTRPAVRGDLRQFRTFLSGRDGGRCSGSRRSHFLVLSRRRHPDRRRGGGTARVLRDDLVEDALRTRKLLRVLGILVDVRAGGECLP
jgi:hypothetical protein